MSFENIPLSKAKFTTKFYLGTLSYFIILKMLNQR